MKINITMYYIITINRIIFSFLLSRIHSLLYSLAPHVKIFSKQ